MAKFYNEILIQISGDCNFYSFNYSMVCENFSQQEANKSEIR